MATGGSVIGRAHKRAGRGSQDAFAILAAPSATIVAVADGCSSGRHSELGAGVGARTAVAAAARRLSALGPRALDDLADVVTADVVEELRRLVRAMSVDEAGAVALVDDALLFTLHVAIVRTDGLDALVFGVGDGVIVIDGVPRVIDQGAAPDYPAYALFPAMPAPAVLVHHRGPVRSLALCTDGALGVDTVALAAGAERNPSLVQKRLNATCTAEDDCTVVVITRDAERSPAADEVLA
jgi:hypothetical protein